MQKTDRIWLDGQLVPWDEAQVHVLTHTLHYGLGVFEGIRCYQQRDGRSAIFRLREHVDRLFGSAHVLDLDLPWSREQIMEACCETVRVNGLRECYLRPIAFLGEGEMGLSARPPTRVAIAAWPWGAYLGAEGLEKGIRIKTSSYARHHVNVSMCRAKYSGTYANSILANVEATEHGYDEGLLLDVDGFVAEGAGENLFVIKNGRILEPELTSALIGITRETVIQLADDLGYKVEARRITRDDLYIADEAFFTGTAAEVTPIREVDGRTIGAGRRGPVTTKIQKAFFDLVNGRNKRYKQWLTPVGEPKAKARTKGK
jgi:branched-chain amino acid aminotransferase